MNSQNKPTVILLLVVSGEIRNYMLSLCTENNFDCIVTTDPEELIREIKKLRGAIAFVDHEALTIYSATLLSKIKVACPNCNVILLSNQDHKSLVKEAMDLGAYACILAPYEKWETLTLIRNILAKQKLRRRKKSDL